MRNKLLLKLFENDKAAEIVARIVRENFNNLPEEVRKRLPEKVKKHLTN